MEPISTPNLLLKALSFLDHVSLWLLTSITLFLLVFLLVPDFLASVPVDWVPKIKCIIVLFAILTFGKGAIFLSGYIATQRAKADARRFHITPTYQLHWSVSRQPDGSHITQLHGHYMAKNRTSAPIQLLRARIVKPKIPGEVLQDMVLIRAEHDNVYGASAVSGRTIPSNQSLPITITLHIRGVPHQKHGDLNAIIGVVDEEGNEQRVTVTFKPVHPAAKK